MNLIQNVVKQLKDVVQCKQMICFAICLIFSVLSVFGQNKQEMCNQNQRDSICLPIYFRFDDDALLWDYRGNMSTWKQIDSLMTYNSFKNIISVSISGSSSYEGIVSYNKSLSSRRANAIAKYLKWKYPQLFPQLIHVGVVTDNGRMLEQILVEDFSVPHRELTMEILRRDIKLDAKLKAIKSLSEEAYEYLQKNTYPYLRAAFSCIIYLSPHIPHQKIEEEQLIAISHLDSVVSTKTEIIVPVNADTTVSESDVMELPIVETTVTHKDYIRRPFFAIKTNLLFDLATALNVEVEVPIGSRWSVAGEWIFPWWLWGDKQNCLQVLSGNLEGRYWLGNRNKHALLTGWFVGLYTGAGLYDLELKRKGYQGEFFIAAGVSGGYAHSIGKNIRMEYSLGIGYLNTKYREYDAKFKDDDRWHLFRSKNGTFSWFGPTRIKVSLVWMPPFKVLKKGGKVQ